MIKAPRSLLADPDLPPTTKIVYLVRLLHSHPSEIQAATGFSRTTIAKALKAVAAKTWSSGGTVPFPRELLADPQVSAQAKLLYGRLKDCPSPVTYERLAAHAGVSPPTVRSAAKALADAGWLRIARKTRLAPIFLTLTSPQREQDRQETEQITWRIRRAKDKGEQIMRELLTLLVIPQPYDDNAYVSHLKNPFTGELLQLDRHYKAGVAFEFNGPGHYEGPEAERQRARDYLKQGMCRDAGITLVVIHPEDLTLESMRAKIGSLLPTRDPRPELARTVAFEARQYLASAGPWTGPANRGRP